MNRVPKDATGPDGEPGLVTHRLEIQYDGTPFRGWSKQPGQTTVEGALEEALQIVLKRRPALTVAGRTDAGVHARRQVVSLAMEEGKNLDRISCSLDALTASELAVVRLFPSPGFDARRDAIERTYKYFVDTGRSASPFLRRYSWHVPVSLDLGAMRAAAEAAVGKHDFTAFTPTETEHVFFDRTVTCCRWEAFGRVLVLTVSANAFLRQMVRTLVGTMVDVGKGRWGVDKMKELLSGSARSRAGITAPAKGLFLWDIDYGSKDVSSTTTTESFRLIERLLP